MSKVRKYRLPMSRLVLNLKSLTVYTLSDFDFAYRCRSQQKRRIMKSGKLKVQYFINESNQRSGVNSSSGSNAAFPWVKQFALLAAALRIFVKI